MRDFMYITKALADATRVRILMALRGGEISDFPLCNKSFNLSYAGHDL